MGEGERDQAGDWRLADRFAPAVRAYATRVCGRRASVGVSDDALRRIAGVNGYRPAPRPVEDRVREAVREAALAHAGRALRRPRIRLRHLARGRLGHATVPELLRRRAAGLLSDREEGRLARMLEGCSDCRRLAGRIDAAEAHLTLAVKEIPEPAVEEIAEPAVEDMAGRSTPSPARAPVVATRPAPPVASGRAPVRPGRRAPGRRRRPVVVVAVVLAGLACAVVGHELAESPAPASDLGSSRAGLLTPVPEPVAGQRPAARPRHSPSWIILG